jgi:hypothetical protein
MIDVNWRITNGGARSPLVILKPSIKDLTGATELIIYAVPKGSDHAYMLQIMPPAAIEWLLPGFFGPLGLPRLHIDKEWYVTIPEGKSANGTINLSAADLKMYFLGALPDEFKDGEAPQLFVHFFLGPFARGEELELDAWTGRLLIQAIAVPRFDKW